jgi:hypothetical protein
MTSVCRTQYSKQGVVLCRAAVSGGGFCAMISSLNVDDTGTQLSAFTDVDDRFRAIFD